MDVLPILTVPLKSPLVALIAPVISTPVAVKAPAADTEKPVDTGPNPIPVEPIKIPEFASFHAAFDPFVKLVPMLNPPIVPVLTATFVKVPVVAVISPVILAAEAVIWPDAFNRNPVFPLAPLEEISVDVIPKPPMVPAVLAVIVVAVKLPSMTAFVEVNKPPVVNEVLAPSQDRFPPSYLINLFPPLPVYSLGGPLL